MKNTVSREERATPALTLLKEDAPFKLLGIGCVIDPESSPVLFIGAVDVTAIGVSDGAGDGETVCCQVGYTISRSTS